MRVRLMLAIATVGLLDAVLYPLREVFLYSVGSEWDSPPIPLPLSETGTVGRLFLAALLALPPIWAAYGFLIARRPDARSGVLGTILLAITCVALLFPCNCSLAFAHRPIWLPALLVVVIIRHQLVVKSALALVAAFVTTQHAVNAQLVSSFARGHPSSRSEHAPSHGQMVDRPGWIGPTVGRLALVSAFAFSLTPAVYFYLFILPTATFSVAGPPWLDIISMQAIPLLCALLGIGCGRPGATGRAIIWTAVLLMVCAVLVVVADDVRTAVAARLPLIPYLWEGLLGSHLELRAALLAALLGYISSTALWGDRFAFRRAWRLSDRSRSDIIAL